MNKKIFRFSLLMVLLVFLAGCGGESSSGNPTAADQGNSGASNVIIVDSVNNAGVNNNVNTGGDKVGNSTDDDIASDNSASSNDIIDNGNEVESNAAETGSENINDTDSSGENNSAPAPADDITENPASGGSNENTPIDYSKYERYRTTLFDLFDSMTIVVAYCESQEEFDAFAAFIETRLQELHRLYDIFRSYSGVNNLYTINRNAGIEPVKVSRDIIDMLLLARRGHELTNGTMNVVMGSVLRIWHDYRSDGVELPPMDALVRAAQNIDINDLIIDEVNSTVFLRKTGMSIDVGGIAKAYAAEIVAKELEAAGLRSALLSVGGNVTAIGKPFDGVRERWGIGVQEPTAAFFGDSNLADTVYLNDATISNSGGYNRFYVVDGKQYNHIIDPVTLMPADRYQQVTVIHPSSGMADVISTAMFILPLDQGIQLAAKTGVEVLWIDNDGQWYATEGYRRVSKAMSGYSAVD